MGQGFGDIFREALPDKPYAPDSCIGLFVWSHAVPLISDGTSTRYVQVQVRDKDPDIAYQRAHAMAPLLDSGMDEQVIQLTADRWCVGRLRTLPKKLTVDESGRTIYYFEVALWGDNRA